MPIKTTLKQGLASLINTGEGAWLEQRQERKFREVY